MGSNCASRCSIWLRVGRFEAQTQIRRLAVGASDAELLDFETAVGFDDFVEDLLHHVGIDQVAFGLNYFFEMA